VVLFVDALLFEPFGSRIASALCLANAAVSAQGTVPHRYRLVEPEKLRLALQARRNQTLALIESGMSQRRVAKALGVDEATPSLLDSVRTNRRTRFGANSPRAAEASAHLFDAQ
jgi:hypothetical protein